MIRQPPTRPYSLISRLFIAQIAPLSLVAIVLLLTGFWTANRVVERTSDRLLAGSMQAILDTVSLEQGQVTVDVSPHALGLLDSPERDAVYYSVREGRRLVTGYDDLPILDDVQTEHPVFTYLDVRGLKVRMAQQAVQIPGEPNPITVSVAQSLDSRQASLRELQFSLLLLPGLLVVLAACLVWPAIRWGLHSLKRLTEDLTSRSAGSMNFSPAPVNLAPRELQNALSAFNALLANLERSTSGMQRFAADASHQLRTPLSVVAANLALLSDHANDWSAADQRLLDDSRRAIADMTRLIQQLLAIARADAKQTLGRADLRRAVRRALENRARTTGMLIRLRQPEHDLSVVGDEALISEQVANLIDNASRYGAPPIHILIQTRSDEVGLTLWDHGPGVPGADLPHLVKRFYRGRPADLGRSSNMGSGLGLSIVVAMAEAQGARFEISNRQRRPGMVVRLIFKL